MRVIAVRMYDNENRMEVFVEAQGTRLVIPFQWFALHPTEAPPSHWLRVVHNEVEKYFKKQQASTVASNSRDAILKLVGGDIR